MKKILTILLAVFAIQTAQSKFTHLDKSLPQDSQLRKACEQYFPGVIHNGKIYKRGAEMQCDFLNKELAMYQEIFKQEEASSLFSTLIAGYHTWNLASEEKVFAAVDTILPYATDKEKTREFDLILSLSPNSPKRCY